MKADEILKIYIQKLKYLNYSPRTIQIYAHYTLKFLEKTDKYHQHLTADDFETYLSTYRFSSIAQQNQVINALRFLYEKVLNKKYNKIDFTRPRKQKQLPKIIDNEFLLSKISLIQNTKHKAILSLAYSVGLRVSEVIGLKISDIDSRRMIIHIRQAKGNKDRILPLSETILQLLRNYYKQYRPVEYLFNGQNGIKYSATSCNQLIKNYIGPDYHFHLLRHSCFTKLMENGTELRAIQKMAGHASSKTTEIYTHVSTNYLKTIALPI